MRAGPADLELVGAAVSALRRARDPRAHSTAAAARTATGRVVAGLGLGIVCAEPVAVGAALALGEPVAVLAAVRSVGAGAPRVSTPCPACRALLRAYAPGVRVLHLADGLQVTPVGELPG